MGKFAPKPADIIGAMQAMDERQTADEAWADCPRSEAQTVVWTEETAAAYFEGAAHLVEAGDHIAARMAFKGSYDRHVSRGRASGRPVRWIVCQGHDAAGREAVLLDAVERGRITAENADALLPYNESPSPRLLALLEQAHKRIAP